MTRTNQNLDDLIAGDTYELEIPVVDDADVPENLTGASIEWALAPRAGAAPLISKSTAGGGVVITDAANGVFQIHLAPEDTGDLSGTYYHEAEVTDSMGNVATVTTGYLTFTEDTT